MSSSSPSYACSSLRTGAAAAVRTWYTWLGYPAPLDTKGTQPAPDVLTPFTPFDEDDVGIDAGDVAG